MAQAVVSLTTPRPRFVLSISDPSATVVVVPALLCELTSSPATQVSQAIEAVRTPGSLTRWVVFGYEGNTGKLKVVEVVYTNHNLSIGLLMPLLLIMASAEPWMLMVNLRSPSVHRLATGIWKS